MKYIKKRLRSNVNGIHCHKDIIHMCMKCLKYQLYAVCEWRLFFRECQIVASPDTAVMSSMTGGKTQSIMGQMGYSVNW